MQCRISHGTVARVTKSAALIAVAACANGEPRNNTSVDPADPSTSAQVVTISAQQLDAAPVIPINQELRIDGEASTDTKFTNITGIGVTGDGGIAILDKSQGDVRVFTADGSLRTRIGRKGDGPGELNMPQALLIANDTIYVVDTRAINRFTVAGEYIDRVPVRMTNQGGYAIPQRLDYTSGGIVTSFSSQLSHTSDPAVVRVAGGTTAVHVLSMPGLLMGEKAFSFTSPERYIIRAGESVSQRMPWFTTQRHMAVTPDARFYVTGLSGRSIDVLGPNADTVVRIVIDGTRRMVTDADVDALHTFMEAVVNKIDPRWEEACRTDPAFEEECRVMEDRRTKGRSALRRSLPRAKYFPSVHRLIATNDGELMVERPELAQGVGGSFAGQTATVWNLLNASGAVVGRIDLPRGFEPAIVHRGLILGVMKDENDVPSVIGYRMAARK